MTSNIITLDLWGGQQTYNKTTETYSINRYAGLFSNITVAMYGILKLYEQKLSVKHIKLALNEYVDETTDLYDSLFITNLNLLNLHTYSNEEIQYALNYGTPSFLGLGREKSHLSLGLYNNIYNTYFQYNNTSNLVSEIIDKYNIDYNNTVFIWARQTDKITEIDLPTLENYNTILVNNNLLNYSILLQTDDLNIVDSVLDKYKHIKILYEMPFTQDGKGFHVNLKSISDQDFINKYQYNKITYLKKMLAMTLIASKSRYYISYPGNLTTFIPILKNTFDNCFSFKNSKKLL